MDASNDIPPILKHHRHCAADTIVAYRAVQAAGSISTLWLYSAAAVLSSLERMRSLHAYGDCVLLRAIVGVCGMPLRRAVRYGENGYHQKPAILFDCPLDVGPYTRTLYRWRYHLRLASALLRTLRCLRWTFFYPWKDCLYA